MEPHWQTCWQLCPEGSLQFLRRTRDTLHGSKYINTSSILYSSVEVLAQALVDLLHLPAVPFDRDCPMAPFAHIDLDDF
jgi:hypothetical protein